MRCNSCYNIGRLVVSCVSVLRYVAYSLRFDLAFNKSLNNSKTYP